MGCGQQQVSLNTKATIPVHAPVCTASCLPANDFKAMAMQGLSSLRRLRPERHADAHDAVSPQKTRLFRLAQ
jgi:hypothetical protein